MTQGCPQVTVVRYDIKAANLQQYSQKFLVAHFCLQCTVDEMPKIEVSPHARDPTEIPEVSFTDFVLESLRSKLPAEASKPWMVST
jgi:hypothetical protein